MYKPLRNRDLAELVGTIETDRVVLKNDAEKYLQVDGNFGTELQNGLTKTFSREYDVAAIDFIKAKYDEDFEVVPVFVWDGQMIEQEEFDSVEAFAQSLVDDGSIILYHEEEQAQEEPEAQSLEEEAE